MRSYFYKSAVWIVAIAFLASGATWRQCSAAHLAAVPVTVAAGHDHAAMHGDHHAGQAATHHVGHDPVSNQQAPDDHACQKCCSMCGVASVMPVTPLAGMVQIASAISFAASDRDIFDRVILLDPGIPKRIS